MRNFVTPLVILVVIISLVALNLSFLKGSTDELSDILTNAKTAVESGNFEECGQHLQDFEKRYEEFDGIYTIVIRHLEMDEIQNCTKKAISYAKNGEKGLAAAEISTLKAYVQHLYEIEQINFYNIV